MMRSLEDLLTAPGHVVAIQQRTSPIFGTTWQPECLEQDCNYIGPHLQTPIRANALAEEHRRKSAGIWRPAR